jgi:DNA mismatch repair ATPase MutL
VVLQLAADTNCAALQSKKARPVGTTVMVEELFKVMLFE